MTFNAKLHWNKSHERHPKDRLPSNYGVEKEKLFPRSSVICDLGGGDGADSFHFLKNGHHVFLYDVSDSALNTAKERAKKEGFEDKLKTQQIDLNADKIPTKDDFFDIVYSRLSLHYFYKDRVIKIFKDIYRILKNGGVSYIVVKSPDDIDEMNFLKSTSGEEDEGVFVDEEGMIKTRFTKDQYKDMLQNSEILNFEINDYVEHFGEQKTYVKSKADKLLYIEIIIKK